MSNASNLSTLANVLDDGSAGVAFDTVAAVPETEYRVDFIGTSTVEFTSNISANFKVKVV